VLKQLVDEGYGGLQQAWRQTTGRQRLLYVTPKGEALGPWELARDCRPSAFSPRPLDEFRPERGMTAACRPALSAMINTPRNRERPVLRFISNRPPRPIRENPPPPSLNRHGPARRRSRATGATKPDDAPHLLVVDDDPPPSADLPLAFSCFAQGSNPPVTTTAQSARRRPAAKPRRGPAVRTC